MTLTLSQLTDATTYEEWRQLMAKHYPTLDEDYHMAVKHLIDLLLLSFGKLDIGETLSLFSSFYELFCFVGETKQADEFQLLRTVLEEIDSGLGITPTDMLIREACKELLGGSFKRPESSVEAV